MYIIISLLYPFSAKQDIPNKLYPFFIPSFLYSSIFVCVTCLRLISMIFIDSTGLDWKTLLDGHFLLRTFYQGSRIVDLFIKDCGLWIFISMIMDCGLHPSPPDVDIGEFSWTPVGQFSWSASCDKPLLLAATFPGKNRFVHISKCICSH